MIEIAPTKQFSVYEVVEWRDSSRPHRRIDDYILYGDYSHNNAKKFSQIISKHGLCVMNDIVPDVVREKTWDCVRKFAKLLLAHYDEAQDEFMDFDMEQHNIVRMPRIGRGKHNIHFDPEFSEQHKVIAELAKASYFSEFLSAYMKRPCTLRETGLTMTRPINNDANFRLTEEERPGEGMEWHSDGAQGEATILLGLQNVSPDQGSLRVVPGSHLRYVEGIGHDEAVLKRDDALLEATKLKYAYRAGKPIIIDARTLHSVDNNVSSDWRIVNWFIFDSY